MRRRPFSTKILSRTLCGCELGEPAFQALFVKRRFVAALSDDRQVVQVLKQALVFCSGRTTPVRFADAALLTSRIEATGPQQGWGG